MPGMFLFPMRGMCLRDMPGTRLSVDLMNACLACDVSSQAGATIPVYVSVERSTCRTWPVTIDILSGEEGSLGPSFCMMSKVVLPACPHSDDLSERCSAPACCCLCVCCYPHALSSARWVLSMEDDRRSPRPGRCTIVLLSWRHLTL